MTAKPEPVQITATLSTMFSCRPGNLRPFSNYYECHGPDGTKFTNTSKETLLSVLRRRYGRVELTIKDER